MPDTDRFAAAARRHRSRIAGTIADRRHDRGRRVHAGLLRCSR